MESLNRVQLRGRVGAVSEITVENSRTYRFSLCTEYVYRAKDGTAVVEATWHKVIVWTKNGERWEWLTKTAPVEVEGRLRQTRYTAKDGSERAALEVFASSVKPVTEG